MLRLILINHRPSCHRTGAFSRSQATSGQQLKSRRLDSHPSRLPSAQLTTRPIHLPAAQPQPLTPKVARNPITNWTAAAPSPLLTTHSILLTAAQPQPHLYPIATPPRSHLEPASIAPLSIIHITSSPCETPRDPADCS